MTAGPARWRRRALARYGAAVTIPGPDPFDAPTQGAELRDDPQVVEAYLGEAEGDPDA